MYITHPIAIGHKFGLFIYDVISTWSSSVVGYTRTRKKKTTMTDLLHHHHHLKLLYGVGDDLCYLHLNHIKSDGIEGSWQKDITLQGSQCPRNATNQMYNKIYFFGSERSPSFYEPWNNHIFKSPTMSITFPKSGPLIHHGINTFLSSVWVQPIRYE